MQLKIYISATFADLEQHRERVYRGLRMFGHDVIAMEDYVAADRRPLEQCLQDVARSDIYVGIFARRYGYIPKTGNPRKKSITELEMREADRLKRPRLIFLLKSTAPWPSDMADKDPTAINALREELEQDRLAGMFETPDELALKVGAAVSRWQMDSSVTQPIPVTQGRAKPAGRATGRKDYAQLWLPGSRLRIAFLNGSAIMHNRVMRLAQLWSSYANVSFEPGGVTDAELRVSFEHEGGNWSAMGTECLEIDDRKEPTLNLGWLREDSPLDELEAGVVHELGHALGLFHEHNNPDAKIAWNKKRAYEQFGGPPNHWSKQVVDDYLFSTWPPDAYPFAKPFDPYSIMANVVPAELTKNGLSIGRNVSLSAGDKEFISRLYPYADGANTVAKAPKQGSKKRVLS